VIAAITLYVDGIETRGVDVHCGTQDSLNRSVARTQQVGISPARARSVALLLFPF
jgi:hypothetical protein